MLAALRSQLEEATRAFSNTQLQEWSSGEWCVGGWVRVGVGWGGARGAACAQRGSSAPRPRSPASPSHTHTRTHATPAAYYHIKASLR